MFASDAVIGLTVGGIIIQNYGWMTTFFTIIPVEIGLLVVIRFFIHINEKDFQGMGKKNKDRRVKNLGL
jgi:predicted MFS family arabinose efflux permease